MPILENRHDHKLMTLAYVFKKWKNESSEAKSQQITGNKLVWKSKKKKNENTKTVVKTGEGQW